MFRAFVAFGGWDIVRASPNQDLVFPVLVYSFLLVKSLKATVMALIESKIVIFFFQQILSRPKSYVLEKSRYQQDQNPQQFIKPIQ